MESKKYLIVSIIVVLVVAFCIIWFSPGNTLNEGIAIFESETTITADLLDNNEVDKVEYLSNSNSITSVGSSVLLSNQDDILITNSGVYELSGSYEDISIVVNVDKTVDTEAVYIVLNNATIQNNADACINIVEAKDVIIVVEENTVNTITQGTIQTSDEDFPSGAIYSKADTLITGNGQLIVDTKYNDGINSRDDLIIEGSNITITSVGDGIVGKDFVAISDSIINIDCEKDGIKSTNTEDESKGHLIIESGIFNINAIGDCISSKNTLQIDDGEFTLSSGGGFVEVLNSITLGEGSGNTVQPTDLLESSMKALKGLNILLNGGEFYISSYEDAINSDNDMTINGGTYVIYTGDDAVHAENILCINAGEITVKEGYEGIEADYIIITGGDISVSVLDDAVNAGSETGYVRITGGNIFLQSSGDGLDSNGDMYIEGGTIILDNNPIYSGGDSEIDVSGQYYHTGGTVQDTNGNDVTANNTQGGGQMPGQMNQGGGRR